MPLSSIRIVVAGVMLIALSGVRLGFLQGWGRPVRVAGGSMAEDLRGACFELPCGDCGFPCRYDAEQPPAHERIVCPNCGFVHRDLHDAVPHPGQRVLIDHLAYRWHEPRRWDAVALRSSNDPDYLEVKRVVGLPGERISIRRGDVYADGRIVRKTLAQLRQIAILVHDNAFEPSGTANLPSRWRAAGSRRWKRFRQNFYYQPDGAGPADPEWLVYHHWRCFASPLPRADEYPVLDNYGYNQDESRQLHRISDLLLVARLRLQGAGGSFTIRAYDGDDWYRAVIEFPARRASLYRSSHCVSTASLPAAAYAQEVKLEFALCDRQAILAVDERVVFSWPYESVDEAGDPCRGMPKAGPAPSVGQSMGKDDRTQAQSQPLGIAVDGLSAVVRRLQVFRDLHYLDPLGLGRDWSAPASLGNDEVLVLGDNVPISRDSRHWNRPGVPEDRILGPLASFQK